MVNFILMDGWMDGWMLSSDRRVFAKMGIKYRRYINRSPVIAGIPGNKNAQEKGDWCRTESVVS